MTSEQWEEATEVDFVAAKPVADTEPAPPPTEPANDRPSQESPRDFEEINGLYYAKPCEHCRELFDHDPACPHSAAVEP